jgi:MoxR-like ATPase
MAHRGRMDDKKLNREDKRNTIEKLLKEIPVGWKP